MLAGCSSNSSDVAQTTEIAAEALEGYKLEKADDGVITLNISKDCEKPYEKACQYIHEKYDTSDETYELDTKISDAKIRWTEIKGTLLYTMEIVGYRKGAEHSEINEVVFYPQIDAYDGSCIEIASTLMR